MKSPVKIAVTGAAGQIAYALVFRLIAGEILGRDQPISLKLIDLPQMEQTLTGIAMELEDGSFPLLDSIEIGSDLHQLFSDIDFALLVGAKPRTKGMERKDLLSENAKIFIEQGKALEAVAKMSTKVIVVGNPCNTNALVLQTHAPKLNPLNVHGLMYLDELRAKAQLAKKAGCKPQEVKGIVIWGNHSTTQVPDLNQCTIQGKKVHFQDSWVKETWQPMVQTRGAEVIKMLGRSSAASAANATLELLRHITTPTVNEQWYSSAVSTTKGPYSIEEGIVFGVPCRTNQDLSIEVVKEVEWASEEMIRKSEKELVEEKEFCRREGIL